MRGTNRLLQQEVTTINDMDKMEFHDVTFVCPSCGCTELVAIYTKGECYRNLSNITVTTDTNQLDWDWDSECFYSAPDTDVRFKCDNCEAHWNNEQALMESGALR